MPRALLRLSQNKVRFRTHRCISAHLLLARVSLVAISIRAAMLCRSCHYRYRTGLPVSKFGLGMHAPFADPTQNVKPHPSPGSEYCLGTSTVICT